MWSGMGHHPRLFPFVGGLLDGIDTETEFPLWVESSHCRHRSGRVGSANCRRPAPDNECPVWGPFPVIPVQAPSTSCHAAIDPNAAELE
jgi:hypothetical protein